MVTYRFIPADTPALRRLPFAIMQAEGLVERILWDRIEPGLDDWLDCTDPARALLVLALAPDSDPAPQAPAPVPPSSAPDCPASRPAPDCPAFSPAPCPAASPGTPAGPPPGPTRSGTPGSLRPAGCVWLNPVVGLCGVVHFCIFRSGRQDWENLGRQAVAHLFRELPLAGLMALWPEPFGHVARAAGAWGFGPALRLPRACALPTPEHPGRCRDGLAAVLHRETFEALFGPVNPVSDAPASSTLSTRER